MTRGTERDLLAKHIAASLFILGSMPIPRSMAMEAIGSIFASLDYVTKADLTETDARFLAEAAGKLAYEVRQMRKQEQRRAAL